MNNSLNEINNIEDKINTLRTKIIDLKDRRKLYAPSKRGIINLCVNPDLMLEGINNQIEDYEIEIERLKLKNEKKVNEKSNFIDSQILLDEKTQTIKIGYYSYVNFDDVRKNKKVKDKYTKTQLKGGMSLIYAIGKVGINGNLSISNLLPNCIEFKKEWKNRVFQERGIQTKRNITRNDCSSANAILDASGLSIRFKLSKPNIIIKK